MTQSTLTHSPAPEGVETPWPAWRVRMGAKPCLDMLGTLIADRTEENQHIRERLLGLVDQIDESPAA